MTSEPERTDDPSTAVEPVSSAKDLAPDAPVVGAAAPQALPQHKVERTRISGTWVATICSAIVLLLLLIFILQNGRTVEVSYFGAHGHLPLGVALLLAAVGGSLLVALAGSARIIQLRRTARRHRHVDAAQNSAVTTARK
jgi:uncharacterized integral membrane protein